MLETAKREEKIDLSAKDSQIDNQVTPAFPEKWNELFEQEI